MSSEEQFESPFTSPDEARALRKLLRRARDDTQRRRAMEIKEAADPVKWADAALHAKRGATVTTLAAILGLPSVGEPGAPGKAVMRRVRALLIRDAEKGAAR